MCFTFRPRKNFPKKLKPSHTYPNKETSKYTKVRHPNSNPSQSIHGDTKHDKMGCEVSALSIEEASRSIVEAIFRSRWNHEKSCIVEKILRVNHSADLLNKFEKYRQRVKSKASKTKTTNFADEKILFDGNELLRFHGCSLTCSLECNGASNVCQYRDCGVCRLISPFCSNKRCSKYVLLSDKTWREHEKVSADGVSENKVIILCRVIAGRVAVHHRRGTEACNKADFDSITCSFRRGSHDIIVFDNDAVLPCFVVMYKVPLVV